jgi:putative ABC transport system ATP-binding protein
MTAEKPPVPKVEKEMGKQLPLSENTVNISVGITEGVFDGKNPNKENVKELVQSVAHDLEKEGILVSKNDIDKAGDSMFQNVSPERINNLASDKAVTKEEIDPKIDLKTYYQTLGEVMDTYNLSKGKWGVITGLLSGNEISATLLGGAQNRELTDENRINRLYERVRVAANVVGLDKTTVADFKEKFTHLTPELKKVAFRYAKNGTWPIWSMAVQKLAEGQVARLAERLYLTERTKLQDMVNTRVAASLFMRDFSFFHDKPIGEIMQTVNRGKEATVDLVATTHFDLVPLIARVISYPFGQAFLGKFAAFAAAIKIPILGITGYHGAKEQQIQSAQEIKAWEKINTELVTTLSNLETMRTAGSPDMEAAILKQTLDDRDYVAAGGLRKKFSRERLMNTIFNITDMWIPSIMNLRSFAQENRDGMSLADYGKAAWILYQRANYAKGEQMMVREAFQSIMQTYIEKIIPDIQDVQKLEELLGPYDALDVPNGPKEQKRVGVDTLTSFDIAIEHVGYKNILHDVSLDVPQGSFTAIKGPSGLGKTTLLRHLVGLYEPEEGNVRVGGVLTENIKKYGDQALLNHIGYAGQTSELLEGWTLRENMLLGTTNVSEEALQTVMHDLGLDELKDRLDTTVKHYSGGEKRRIGIARALLKNPKILILDEPTAHLDAKSTQQVLDIIQDLRKKKPDMTVLAITHDPTFESIAERVIDFEQINKKPALGENQVFEASAKPS